MGEMTAGEFGPTRLHDASVDEHVHGVGSQLVEQSLVMGDGEDAEIRTGLDHSTHTGGHHAQCIDVET